MSSESEIKGMLIDALRPVMLEVIQQALTPLDGVRSEVTEGAARLDRRLDDFGGRTSKGMAALEKLCRCVEQELNARLDGLEAQLLSIKAGQDRFERRFAAAGAELCDELLRLQEPETEMAAARPHRRDQAAE